VPKHRTDRRLFAFVKDFVTGLAAFAGIALACGTRLSVSEPDEPLTFSASAWAAAEPAGLAAAHPLMSLAILGLVFATIAALNLGFLRHLRRAYASPRTGAWRRGRSR
jgi:hypothetical protein